MFVLLSYWNGKNSSKQKTVITVSKTSNDEDEITIFADELLQEKLNLLDYEQEITEGVDIDPADLFVRVDELAGEVIYHKSAGPTGVNEWHVVIVAVEDLTTAEHDSGDTVVGTDVVSSFVKTLTITQEISALVIEAVRKAIGDDDGEISDIRSIYVSEILQQLSNVDDESLSTWLEDLQKQIIARRG